ncbi:MAG: hypothetical protein HUJ70_10515, partial [Pseudobutyrivibrio sp.]|nr:hypothetical protein [Pseudobutyrivibrio sp.]
MKEKKRKNSESGYIVNGGIKAVPHNLLLDIKRNPVIYILLLIWLQLIIKHFQICNMKTKMVILYQIKILLLIVVEELIENYLMLLKPTTLKGDKL